MFEEELGSVKERVRQLAEGAYDGRPYYGFVQEEEQADWQYLY